MSQLTLKAVIIITPDSTLMRPLSYTTQIPPIRNPLPLTFPVLLLPLDIQPFLSEQFLLKLDLSTAHKGPDRLTSPHTAKSETWTEQKDLSKVTGVTNRHPKT